jgi:hypothetical protein
MGYKIGAVVEGSSDEDVIRAILKSLSKKLNASLSLKVKVARGGKIKNKRILEKSVWHLKVRGCQRVMVLIDSHCNPSDIRNDFEGYIESIGGELFVVKHAIESWLLADVDAISTVLMSRIKEKIPKLEECHEPKEVLKGIFKKYANRDYVEVKDAGKIAEKADVNIMEKYSNFKDFMNSLFDCT